MNTRMRFRNVDSGKCRFRGHRSVVVKLNIVLKSIVCYVKVVSVCGIFSSEGIYLDEKSDTK